MKTSTLFASALALSIAVGSLTQALAQTVAAPAAQAAPASAAPTAAAPAAPAPVAAGPTAETAKPAAVAVTPAKAGKVVKASRHAERKAQRHERRLAARSVRGGTRVAQAKVTYKAGKSQHRQG